ncbi:PD-(D/E)XK nuclease family protein [candidate division KSB1 bacterium]|nr:PD-(D/E)XK nuclease family protein [candidate division KSB1 bacterium]
MKNVHFVHIPFTQNLIQVLVEHSTDNTLYVFPTQAGKRATIREFQNHRAFQNIQFLTMEELKELLCRTNKPILKEEKRTLAFFAVLTASDKQFFRTGNYFQSVELARSFFELWKEWNEELIPDNFDQQILRRAGAELLNWQLQTYERLKSIKGHYRHYIEKRGFTDQIFLFDSRFFNFDILASFQSVYFINQFYYTALERNIIRHLADEGVKTVLYYQLAAEWVNPETLAIRPFTVRDLGEGRTEQIDIIKCTNEFTMLCGLLEQVHRQKVRSIINFSPSHNPHARFLSPAFFNLGASDSFTTTSLFQFMQTLQALLESLVYEPSRRIILAPIQSILQAMLNGHFSTYLIKGDANSLQSTLDFIYDLIAQEYKFVDLDGTFLDAHRNRAVKSVQLVLNFIKSFLQIDSISSLIAKIDVDEGIIVKALLTEEEKNSSNLLEVFYRALADLSALEKIAIIDDWKSLFADARLAPMVQMPAGLLRLFLNYLKSRSIHHSTVPVDSPRVEFTDLQDTRNLSYAKIAVMNVVEKEMPSARQTPFLFTERQRHLLGLKTYDDIKLREKYYFMRLVLTSPYVSLITQKNILANIDVSSFVEEIELYFARDKMKVAQIDSENYVAFHLALLDSKHDYKVAEDKPLQNEFYVIPLQPERDFPQKSLNLSYYTLTNLLGNAFTFYLKKVIGVDEKAKEVSADYSPRLIGNLVHDCLNRLWRDILEQQIMPPYKIDFAKIQEDLVARTLSKTLRTDRFYYTSPHDFTHTYFMQVVAPRIQKGICQFFHYLDRIGLSNISLDIFPEKEERMRSEDYLPYIQLNDIDLTINIGGRADLRIETADKSHFYIFDYKTGNYDKDQLIFYELFYYLIQQLAREDQISSCFYQVLDARGKELREFNHRKSKQDVLSGFSRAVQNQVVEFCRDGFAIAEKKYMLDDMEDISRKDLYLKTYLPLKNRWR